MPKLIIALMTVLLLFGCGRKEIPSLQQTSATPPAITKLSHKVIGQVVHFHLNLEGGSGSIGYQLDRAVLDPYCKCPSSWQRYSEMSPLARHQGERFSRLFALPLEDTTYLFRMRAVDGQGHLGAWSQTMQAHSDKDRLK
ncbi:MAG: hypothetical protein Q9M28_06475 [Mariprofundaceae bacterium]|nr:hypothetical protein [Mariprofundaceae bacterium]